MNSIKDHAENVVTDDLFARRSERWLIDTPDTKEGYFIREIFESSFSTEAAASTAVRYVIIGSIHCYESANTDKSNQVDPSWRLGMFIRPKWEKC